MPKPFAVSLLPVYSDKGRLDPYPHLPERGLGSRATVTAQFVTCALCANTSCGRSKILFSNDRAFHLEAIHFCSFIDHSELFLLSCPIPGSIGVSRVTPDRPPQRLPR